MNILKEDRRKKFEQNKRDDCKEQNQEDGCEFIEKYENKLKTEEHGFFHDGNN